MITSNILGNFFSRIEEKKINTLLLDREYALDREAVLSYIKQILAIDIVDYLKYISNDRSLITIDSLDMLQFSSIHHAREGVVKAYLSAGDNGYTHIETGKLLQNDGKVRKTGANCKYGENHAKMATYFGYLFEVDKYYYVSCIGYLLDELTSEEKDKLFVRLFLRTNLFRTIYKLSENENVELRKVFDFLSDSTYKRRKTNMKTIFSIINQSKEYDFSDFFNKIVL